MLRSTVKLLTIATGLVVVTASACPPDLCEEFPEISDFCFEVTESSDESEPELAAGEEEPVPEPVPTS